MISTRSSRSAADQRAVGESQRHLVVAAQATHASDGGYQLDHARVVFVALDFGQDGLDQFQADVECPGPCGSGPAARPTSEAAVVAEGAIGVHRFCRETILRLEPGGQLAAPAAFSSAEARSAGSVVTASSLRGRSAPARCVQRRGPFGGGAQGDARLGRDRIAFRAFGAASRRPR